MSKLCGDCATSGDIWVLRTSTTRLESDMDRNRKNEMYLTRPVLKVSDIPNGPHWAVLVQVHESFFVPGDERSRTNPGHGYPEHTESIDRIDYFSFKTKELAMEYVEYITTEKISKVDVANVKIVQVSAAGAPRMKTTVEF